MRVDEIEELRGIMRSATLALAGLHLPWGSGIGSFVPAFQQALPDTLLLPTYINAAHNDYAQVWLESGIAGLLAAIFCFAALARSHVTHALHHEDPGHSSPVKNIGHKEGLPENN